MNDQIRSRLRNVVGQCRRLIEESIALKLQGRFGFHSNGTIEKDEAMSHLSKEDLVFRQQLLVYLQHFEASGCKPADSFAQLVREAAFTHLNRLCAYKMMEVRDVYVGGQRFREAVSRGLKSQGFRFYLADHPEDERRYNAGQQEEAYRHFLNWLGGTLSQEISVLFSPTDPANRVYPPQRVLDEVLDLLNVEELKGIWSEDETIGWVYQYFTPKELRDQARRESQAPRNSYELAFRNQFFTPRYVVEFLTDNTLGRIWYEMRRGNTRLKDECRYMVRRPTEVFLRDPDHPLATPPTAEWVKAAARGDFSQLPDEPTIDDLSDFSLIHDGYELAERLGFGDCIKWADRQLETYRQGGELPKSSVELWLLLFRHQRYRGRSDGRGPSNVEEWRSIFLALKAVLTDLDESLPQEELLRQPVYIPHRPKKDPRDIKILDPACGSGHFLLYCFALLLVIYEEAYDDPDLGPGLQSDYPTKDDLRKAIPGLILRHNLHGIDIDLRCTQIAALALWLRCQRAYQEMGLKKDRPPILKANVVCAEPMPGEEGLLHEFLKTLQEDRLEALIRQVMNVSKDQRVRATRGMVESLSDLVRTVWDKMRLAGEAGSLLKVEHELQDAIRRGQEQWEERLPLFRFTEYGLSEEPKERLVRFVPGDVDGERVTFWDKAETLVRRALDEFVTFASNGGRFQRQLFVEDAQQGLGFVDVSRRRFDVVLMNPPFGESSKPSKRYVEASYPRTKSDVYAAFVERGLSFLLLSGMLGAITSRTGLFLRSFQKWREEILLNEAPPIVVTDLGQGVLDTAMVETAAYCLAKGERRRSTYFFRLLQAEDKKRVLQRAKAAIDNHEDSSTVFVVDPSSFRQVPGSPFAYWVSEQVRRLYRELPPIEAEGRTAKVGLMTQDDFRFVRLWTETPRSKEASMGWLPFNKGGSHGQYYRSVPLQLNWKNGGQELKGFHVEKFGTSSKYIFSEQYYGRPGITYTQRTQLGFATRIMPSGLIFSHKGPAVIGRSESDNLALLGITNSSCFRFLISMQMAFGSYEVGVIQRTPVPDLACPAGTRLAEVAYSAVELKRQLETSDEFGHVFHLPALLQVSTGTLTERAFLWREKRTDTARRLDETQREIDDIGFALYNLDAANQQSIEEFMSSRLASPDDDDPLESDEGDRTDAESERADTSLVSDLVSYAIGCVFGRWDIRLANCDRNRSDLPDPFDSLPVCSPGMLQGHDGMPLLNAPDAYPLPIDWDGILADDPDHPDDIIRRVRDVLEVIWKDLADAIEREACEIIGVADLRDFFRKPGAGGFWDDHIKRYTKSRRKAPIYWLLQSSKKNYALWIYYHRLDRDILFKALLNYVEPKIRKEDARLGELRSQKVALGPAAKGSKKLDKDIDRQEAFLSELRDFEDKLRRAADLHLDPDLNDGVVLNIAPLRDIVPWKEARSYWDELMDGKYEWSSIGKQLREKGLVP